MNMTRAQIMLLLAVAGAIVFGQTTFQLPRRLIGVQPDLLPVLMIYAGLWGEPLLVSLLSLVGGLLQDSLSSNPMGTSIIPLLAVGLASHAASEILLRDQLHVRCIVGGAACAISTLLSLGIMLLNGERPMLGTQAIWILFSQCAFGALVSPLIFKGLDLLDRSFNHPRLPVTAFRADREIKRGRF